MFREISKNPLSLPPYKFCLVTVRFKEKYGDTVPCEHRMSECKAICFRIWAEDPLERTLCLYLTAMTFDSIQVELYMTKFSFLTPIVVPRRFRITIDNSITIV